MQIIFRIQSQTECVKRLDFEIQIGPDFRPFRTLKNLFHYRLKLALDIDVGQDSMHENPATYLSCRRASFLTTNLARLTFSFA
jgi:hypothetical protein